MSTPLQCLPPAFRAVNSALRRVYGLWPYALCVGSAAGLLWLTDPLDGDPWAYTQAALWGVMGGLVGFLIRSLGDVWDRLDRLEDDVHANFGYLDKADEHAARRLRRLERGLTKDQEAAYQEGF